MKKNKKRHFAVIGVVFNKKNQILLSLRNEPKSTHSHGKWQFPGGGIKFGESPNNALMREIQEEVGLSVKLLSKHPLVFSHWYKEENIHVVLLAYPAKYLSGTIDTSKDLSTGDAQWFDYNRINFSDCLPHTKEIIDDAVEQTRRNN